MADPLRFRASNLSSYPDCPLRAAVAQFAKLFQAAGWELAPPRSNVGAVLGSAYHGGAEPALIEASKGSRMPLSAIEDAAIETLRERAKEEREQSVELIMTDECPSIDAAELQARRMLKVWHEQVLPTVSPIVVESQLEAEYRPGVIITGRADLLHLDQGAGARKRVVDHKTGRQRLPAMKHGPQLGTYSLLFRSQGYETDAGRIDFNHVRPLKKPAADIEQFNVDIVAAENMAVAVLEDYSAKVEAFAKDGNPGRLICNPGSYLCSAKFCRAHGKPVCPATYEGGS